MISFTLLSFYFVLYFLLGCMFAEVVFNSYQPKPVYNPKAAYALIAILWPLCILFLVYYLFNQLGKKKDV